MNIAARIDKVCMTAAAAGLLVFANSAQAIVSTSASSHWLPSSLGDFWATSDRLDGVAKLTINGSTGCSGTLLAGGAYVLTAAHCVTDAAGTTNASSIVVSFKGNTVNNNVSLASQISVFSSWAGKDAGLGNNDDLALLRLDSLVTDVSGYSLYTGDAMGQTFVLAGYGYTGLGSSGHEPGTFGTLHWGANQYEAMAFNETKGTSGSYLFDFDDGTPATNVFAAIGDGSSTGLGSFEAMIAQGDSGGSSFILGSDGKLYLSGVHSFIAAATGQPTGVYGNYGGDTVFNNAQTLSWLSSETLVTSVPEPTSFALLLAGLTGLAWRRRRGAR
jgi:hypothetical protein